LVTPIDVELVLGARVTVRMATMPLAIVFVLIPVTRHMYAPPEPAQEMLLPAAVVAAPGTTEIDAISDGE
jgi:hypothetical protein